MTVIIQNTSAWVWGRGILVGYYCWMRGKLASSSFYYGENTLHGYSQRNEAAMIVVKLKVTQVQPPFDRVKEFKPNHILQEDLGLSKQSGSPAGLPFQLIETLHAVEYTDVKYARVTQPKLTYRTFLSPRFSHSPIQSVSIPTGKYFLISITVGYFFSVLELHTNGIIEHVLFCVWLLLLHGFIILY